MSLDADRARLLALLRELSFERRKVVLASGKESDFYVDCKRTALTAEGHVLVGRLLFDRIRRLRPPVRGAGGLTLGADPLASAVSFTSCAPWSGQPSSSSTPLMVSASLGHLSWASVMPSRSLS